MNVAIQAANLRDLRGLQASLQIGIMALPKGA